MKGLVVYHSKFGNCRKIAEMIAEGLEDAGHSVSLVTATQKKVGADFDFLAAGGPTHMGRMTRPLKGFLRREIGKDWKGKPFIAFGTGLRPADEGTCDKYDVKSATRVYDLLKAEGLVPAADAFIACVEDTQGPLADGEEERALQFGRDAGKALAGNGGRS